MAFAVFELTADGTESLKGERQKCSIDPAEFAARDCQGGDPAHAAARQLGIPRQVADLVANLTQDGSGNGFFMHCESVSVGSVS